MSKLTPTEERIVFDEKKAALKIANYILDIPYADPDGDYAVLARQFIRLEERMRRETNNMSVICGKLLESPTGFKGGCGQSVNIMKVYACVDCSAPFHRKCLLKHIHEDMPVISLTKMPLEEAFKKIDSLTGLNETKI